MKDASSKREEIVSAARELLLNNSYATVNMSTIAATCGVTKAAIYYHFKNKEELIRECLRESLNNINAMVYRHCAKSITVREKLLLISGEIYRIGQENPGSIALFMRSITEPEMREILGSLEDEVTALLREVGEVIRYGFKTGEIREDVDPFLAALMLMGTFLMHLQSGIYMARQEEIDPCTVVDTLFRGIGHVFPGKDESPENG